MRILNQILVVGVVLLLSTPTASAFPIPKMDNGMDGFGGFIVGMDKCICKDIGILIRVAGPYGGDFIFSFRKPPSIQVGAFFLSGGPILGATRGGGSCGTDIDDGHCEGEKSGKIITWIGGLLQL